MGAHRESLTLAAVASSVLAIATLVYVLDRDPALVPFFASITLYGTLPSVFGAAGQVLPTFAHAFAFSLLTATALGPTRRHAVAACGGWLVVGVVFEALQRPEVAGRLVSSAGAASGWGTMLEPLRSYAVHGTYDPLDVISIVAGAVGALVVILFIRRNRNEKC